MRFEFNRQYFDEEFPEREDEDQISFTRQSHQRMNNQRRNTSRNENRYRNFHDKSKHGFQLLFIPQMVFKIYSRYFDET